MEERTAPPGEPEEEEAEAAEGSDASLEELLAKRAEKQDADSDDESILSVERDDRTGGLPNKVKPQQAREFVCKKCFLVKHQSQLADRRRMLCRDCA